MSAADDAFQYTKREIAKAKAEGWDSLDLSVRETRALMVLPDEISDLTELRMLYLSYSQISNVAPLACLTHLTNLYLCDTRISDVTPLTGLTALTDLSLRNTEISNTEPLAGLKALASLRLYNTRVKDVTPLAGLTALTRLHIGENQIRDLRPLTSLNKLAINPDYVGLYFRNTAATKLDLEVARISLINDNKSRAAELFSYLETWVPPDEVVPGLNL